jgi:NhaP-type Na+/H+ or K+/H+ antiporter
MFTFVLLGGSLIWAGLGSLTATVAVFIVLSLFIRPVVLLAALAREKMDRKSRFFITWFGPRGLSTLLLGLVPAFVGIPGAEKLFAISGLVVLLSVLIHGGSIMFLGRKKPLPRSEMIRLSPHPDRRQELLVKVNELPTDIMLADVRSAKAFNESPHRLKGAVRLDPEHPVRDAERSGFNSQTWIALFCT